MYADYNCNSDKFPAELPIFSWMVRHDACTLTRYALKDDGQTPCFKLMSKDYHGEVAKSRELVLFRTPTKQAEQAEQWREAHWVGKSKRSDEQLLVIRGSTYSARAIRRKPHDEQWNLESVKAVLVSPWELRVRTGFDAPVTRQKYITNQMLDQYGRTPLCTRCSLGTGSHSSDRRTRFEAVWTKELAEAEVPIRGEAEVANRAVDVLPMDPNVRERVRQWTPQLQPVVNLLRWR